MSSVNGFEYHHQNTRPASSRSAESQYDAVQADFARDRPNTSNGIPKSLDFKKGKYDSPNSLLNTQFNKSMTAIALSSEVIQDLSDQSVPSELKRKLLDAQFTTAKIHSEVSNGVNSLYQKKYQLERKNSHLNKIRAETEKQIELSKNQRNINMKNKDADVALQSIDDEIKAALEKLNDPRTFDKQENKIENKPKISFQEQSNARQEIIETNRNVPLPISPKSSIKETKGSVMNFFKKFSLRKNIFSSNKNSFV